MSQYSERLVLQLLQRAIFEFCAPSRVVGEAGSMVPFDVVGSKFRTYEKRGDRNYRPDFLRHHHFLRRPPTPTLSNQAAKGSPVDLPNYETPPGGRGRTNLLRYVSHPPIAQFVAGCRPLCCPSSETCRSLPHYELKFNETGFQLVAFANDAFSIASRRIDSSSVVMRNAQAAMMPNGKASKRFPTKANINAARDLNKAALQQTQRLIDAVVQLPESKLPPKFHPGRRNPRAGPETGDPAAQASRLRAENRLAELRETMKSPPLAPKKTRFRADLPRGCETVRRFIANGTSSLESNRFLYELMLDDSRLFRLLDQYVETTVLPEIDTRYQVAFALLQMSDITGTVRQIFDVLVSIFPLHARKSIACFKSLTSFFYQQVRLFDPDFAPITDEHKW
jgi:hypothetical protein